MSGRINKLFGGEGERAGRASGEQNGADRTEQPAAAGIPAPSPGNAPAYHTYLGAGSSLEGKISCKGPARFGGVVNGEIMADGLVAIDDGATVTANINVKEAVIGGRVMGNVAALSRVSLAPTACIDGDIQTPSLSIAEGAQVKGKVDVAPAAGARPEAPQAGPKRDF